MPQISIIRKKLFCSFRVNEFGTFHSRKPFLPFFQTASLKTTSYGQKGVVFGEPAFRRIFIFIKNKQVRGAKDTEQDFNIKYIIKNIHSSNGQPSEWTMEARSWFYDQPNESLTPLLVFFRRGYRWLHNGHLFYQRPWEQGKSSHLWHQH